jgi:hypothetical protein
MMRRFVKGWNRSRLLNEFIPVPPELNDSAMTMEKLKARHKQKRNAEYEKELTLLTEELNKKYFGYKDWHGFCLANWGTKWDIGFDTALGGHLTPDFARKPTTLYFDSAWSPPIEAYAKLSEMGFSIRAYYFEGGMMFCGKWEDGDDQYYDIKECKSDWVKENIPADINAYMGISDCMELDEEIEEDDPVHPSFDPVLKNEV